MTRIPTFVQQISTVCREAPVADKLLIVPTTQAGTEMRTATALSGQPVAGLRISTLLAEAERIIQIADPASVRRRISWSVVEVLVEQILADQPLPAESPMHAAAGSITRTLRDLRLGGKDPDSYRRTARSAFSAVVLSVYRSYLERLETDGLLDEAAVLARATTLLTTGACPSAGIADIVMVSDVLDLPATAFRFVEALGARADAQYRLSDVRTGAIRLAAAPSKMSAARRVVSWPVPAHEMPEAAPAPRVLAALGTENEVRAVLRHVVSEELAVDSIEVAYPAHHPYLSLVREYLGRMEVPATFAAGVAATDTGAGQAVRLFLKWMDGGLRSDELMALLRSGLIRLVKTGPDVSLAAADLLGAVRIGNGLQAYEAALDGIRARLGSDEHSDAARARHDRAADVLKSFVRVVPDTPMLTPAGLSRAIGRFVSQYVAHSQDDAPVRHEISTRFMEFGEVAGDKPVSRRLLLRRYLDLLDRMFVHARASRPGHVHVVPLSSAGFSGRDRLFVLGMDQQTFGGRIAEDAFLPDADRELMLAEDSESPISVRSDAVGQNRWLLESAMARASAGTVLTVNRYDVADDRELYPSAACLSILSQIGVQLGGLPVHHYFPDPVTPVALETAESVLASRGSEAARSFAHSNIAFSSRAAVAGAALSSAEWTSWDGIVPEDEQLDPLKSGRRMSPSRLETLAACPYRYYLKYVLRIKVADTRDDDRWIEGRESGALIHDVFSDVVSDAIQSNQTLATLSENDLIGRLDAALDRFVRQSEPPHPAALERVRGELHAAGRVFLADERAHPNRTPVAAEMGFGLEADEARSERDRVGPYALCLGHRSIPLRGFIDRIDRTDDGTLAVRDYKTGSAFPFSGDDLLDHGARLQWALYGFAAEDALEAPVSESGYVFTSARELGLELKAPLPDRAELGEVIGGMTDRAAMGLFPHAAGSDACKFCDYKRVCGDLDERKLAVSRKLASEDARSNALESWRR